MSASYFMLKMVKKKQMKTPRNVKKEPVTKYSDCGSSVCRICLNEGHIPIYGEKASFNLPNDIQTIGGVEVNENDPYPKNLCQHCLNLLKGAVLFRKSAKESYEILRHKHLAYTNTQMERVSFMSKDAFENSDNDFETNSETKDSKHNESESKTTQMKIKTVNGYSRRKVSKLHKKILLQCNICMKLLTRQLYTKHLVTHQSSSHLVCEICGKLYRKDNLLRHLQLHSNELPYQCSQCPYRGRFTESLRIHMRTHSGYKPFSCEKCELRFITKSNLNRHLLTHEKEKPFKCVECNRAFNKQKDMEIHLKGDHAGIKEFGCGKCENKYGTKRGLMRHTLRVHKRDKMVKGRMPLYLQPSFQPCMST